MDWVYLIEVLVGGLLSGVMYSLVAIGFVLIYKSSGIFNFAQGIIINVPKNKSSTEDPSLSTSSLILIHEVRLQSN